MGAKYYTLVAALPRMVDFDAPRLPITEPRLRQRLKMLSDVDIAQLDAVGGILRLHAQPLGLSDRQVGQLYRQALEQITHPVLRDLLEYRMEQLTILAALRRRRRQSMPQDGGWGMTTRARWLVRHWDHPDFALRHVYPWLVEAGRLLEQGRAATLQTLLWRQLWNRLTSYQNAEPFGLVDVFATVLKWHLLRLRTGQDADASARRFEELCEEVTRDKLP